jgi:hypothetical protein
VFEKEAIRHAFEDTIGVECLIKPVEDFTYEELSDEQQEKAYNFQKGAEFGYNKAKEDADKMKSRFLELCNLKDIRIAELEKTNEWHYPSKGELPKCDEETQLIFYVNCYYEVGGETLTRKRMVLGFYKKSFLNDDVKLFVERSKGYEDEHLPKDVIAWKEIILPKESE